MFFLSFFNLCPNQKFECESLGPFHIFKQDSFSWYDFCTVRFQALSEAFLFFYEFGERLRYTCEMNDFLRPIFHLKNKGLFIIWDIVLKEAYIVSRSNLTNFKVSPTK